MNSKYLSFLVTILSFFLLSSASASAQTYLGDFTSYSTSGKSVTVQAGSSALRFVFYKPNLVRVDFLPTLSTTFDTSLVVVQDTTQLVSYSVADSDSTFVLSTSSLRIICQKFPLRVAFYNVGDQLLLEEPILGGMSSYQSERIANFSIQPNEHFYGTGERGMSLDLRGQAFDSYNEQHGDYGSPAPPTMNVNIPFIISTNNYGLYFDDTYKGHFDIGNSNPNQITYTVYGGELSYYFIYDLSMSDVLSDYTWLTGRAPLLPKWAYGYIQSKFGYRNVTDATQMIQRMRNDSIPCDAIILDLYWFQNMGDLTWNINSWPNPSQITSNFLSQGFKTIVITEPYIVQPSINFSTADADGYLAKNSSNQSYILPNWWSCGCNAGLLDITNPAAQSWWWSKYYSIFSTGVSGLWTDLGEPERDYSDMQFYMGPDLKIHNIYDFLWAKTLFNGFSKSFPNERMFNLTRSGYAGIQRFGVVTWSGDVSKTFGGLAVQLPMLLNMGMSGMAYHNSDIGGFTGNQPTTPELYTRWMEFGAFCPVMRAHGYDGLGGTEPWAFNSTNPATENIVRNIIRLRYSLLPYNYTMAHETYTSGIPLSRPLILEYPGDQNVYNESSAYMWGDDFLVAPVVQSGQAVQTFYLPQGKWINFWNDEVYTGGTSVTVQAPIDEVPLFVKAGSIIPMQPVMNYTGEFPADTIMLAIYPDPNTTSTFTLYEDDGKTLDYQSGAFAATTFEETLISTGNSNNMQISIGASVGNYNGKPSRRVYICEIHKISYQPAGVVFQNSFLPKRSTYDSLRSNDSGYYYDGSSSILYVKISAGADSAYSISVDSVKQNPGNPSGCQLEQNFPNPFSATGGSAQGGNPSTTIRFLLSSRQKAKLTVFDTLGREVALLLDGEVDAGEHSVVFNAQNLSSGVYFYRLTAGAFQQTKAMVLIK
ncbi:MAG: DUF5110 domain-containing protein [Bacteroidetes bacterium]|nr:DUF5110 domain-containing protein [Bacteroidota bacterium]MCL5737571.1 DUF5110 domain-containing protein [Bacteroidota bacterium]